MSQIADVGGDDGDTGRQRLEHDVRQTFTVRGEQSTVASRSNDGSRRAAPDKEPRLRGERRACNEVGSEPVAGEHDPQASGVARSTWRTTSSSRGMFFTLAFRPT